MKKLALILSAMLMLTVIPAMRGMAAAKISISNSGRNVTITYSNPDLPNSPIAFSVGALGTNGNTINAEVNSYPENQVNEASLTTIHYADAGYTDSAGNVVFRFEMPPNLKKGQRTIYIKTKTGWHQWPYTYDENKNVYTSKYEKVIHYDFENEPVTGRNNIILTDNKYFPDVPSVSLYTNSSIVPEKKPGYGREDNGCLYTLYEGDGNEASCTILSQDYCKDAIYSDNGKNFRTGYLAFSFMAAISPHVKLKINSFGVPSGYSTTSTNFYKTYMLETQKTGGTFISYDAVKNNKNYSGYTTYSNIIERDRLVRYTVIFDKLTSTYDLYIDNSLVMENRVLAGPLYPAGFQVSASLYADEAALAAEEKEMEAVPPTVYFDDFELYTLSAEDLAAQYSLKQTTGGRISLDKAVVKKGDKVNLSVEPELGYIAKWVTIEGETYPVSEAGGVFELSSATTANGEIYAYFERKRPVKELFGVSFDEFDDNENFLKGNKAEKNLVFYETENGCDLSLVTMGEAKATVVEGKLYVDVPSASEGVLKLNGGVKENMNGPFALDFKMKLEKNAALGLKIKTSEKTVEAAEIDFSLPELSYMTGELRDYRFIFNPESERVCLMADGVILADEYVGFTLSGGSSFILGIRGAENTGAEIESVSMYSLDFDDIPVQPVVFQQGKGRVSFDKSVYTEGDTAEVTVTPPPGGYIENLSVNGIPIAAFDKEKVSFLTGKLTGETVINAVFKELSQTPEVKLSPLTLRDEAGTYVFFKIVSGRERLEEAGMEISATDSTLSDETVKKVPFDDKLTSNGRGISAKGYYGYRIIRTDKTAPFYIRPYAACNGEIYTGDISYIEPENIFVAE